jgi:hypothetical protein
VAHSAQVNWGPEVLASRRFPLSGGGVLALAALVTFLILWHDVLTGARSLIAGDIL